MNEKYPSGDRSPRLSEIEINLLVARAMIDGDKTVVDYADIQPKDRPMPHFYTVEIDPNVVQEYMDENERYSEAIESVILEYDDPRILYKGGPLLPARLNIVIESVIRDHLAPDLQYRKAVAYRLYLHPDAQWDVTETYYDAKDDPAKSGAEKADEMRPLNDKDVALLQHLI